MKTSRSAWSRQALFYLLAGFAQLAIDSLVYIALTASGVPVAAGNIAGRVAAAVAGYGLNGRYTFARDGQPQLRGDTLRRYGIAWLALTVASTLAVTQVAAIAGLQGSWLAKPVVEAVMAAISFFLQRQWVFR